MLRVVVFARRDAGGSWAHLAACLRAQGLADVRVIAFEHDPALGWATDIADVYDGGQELAHLVEHADAFHFVDLVPEEVTLLGQRVQARCDAGAVRVVLQCDVRPSFARARELARLCAQHGWSLATTRPLARELPGATLLAPFIPLWRAPWIPLAEGAHARLRRGDRTVLATSTQSLRERPVLERWVDQAECIARGLPGVRIDVLTGKPQSSVLQRRRRSHLALVGGDGLGRTAFESLAQGIPTVTELSATDIAAWTELAGGRPPPVIAPAKLELAIHGIVQGGEPQASLRAWASHVLDPQRWLDACACWYGAAARARAA